MLPEAVSFPLISILQPCLRKSRRRPTGTRRAGLLAVVVCFLFLVLVKVAMFPSPVDTPLPVRPMGMVLGSRETAPQDGQICWKFRLEDGLSLAVSNSFKFLCIKRKVSR